LETSAVTTHILHITTRQAWEAAQASGEYRVDSLEREGFIHCSTADQVLRVANALFAGARDLVLLHIDPVLLNAPLRYEPPAHTPDQPVEAIGTERFPHVYGPINLEAVVRVTHFAPDAEGRFTHFP
jgi:uncharacterized protein (DUF952 family)